MNTLKRAITLMIVGLMACLPLVANAQVAYRLTEKEMKALLERIEQGADRFRDSLADSLDASYLDDTRTEDNINQFIKEFEAATDHLEDRFDNNNSAAGDVEEVLRRAVRIDNFMMQHGANSRAHANWMSLRGDLDQLARAYNVVWTWAGITRAYRLTDEQVKTLLDRIERDADTFRKSLDDALDKSRFNSTGAEDDINAFVKGFEEAADRLEDRFDKKQSAAGDAEEVLRRAARIDAFMRTHSLTPRAQEDWQRLRADLDEIAAAYSVEWRWM